MPPARHRVLYALAVAGRPVRVRDLGRRIGHSVRFTHDHLMALRRAGLVLFDPAGYRVMPGVVVSERGFVGRFVPLAYLEGRGEDPAAPAAEHQAATEAIDNSGWGVSPGPRALHGGVYRMTTATKAAEARNGTANRPLNLYQKLAAISGELGAISKDARAPEVMGGYAFTSHAALMGHLRQRLADRNVLVFESLFVVADEAVTIVTRSGERPARRVRVRLVVDFVDGDDPEQRQSVEWPGEALDTGDKATQKAGTSAEKYLLMKTFKVSDRDDPDAADTGELSGQGGQEQRSSASGFTTPRAAREQPPQGRTPAPESKPPIVCPKCGTTGSVIKRSSDGQILCVLSKNGCGAFLTEAELVAAIAKRDADWQAAQQGPAAESAAQAAHAGPGDQATPPTAEAR